ncbi:PREDICTED: BTB/POZ domain-containing protein At5g47800 isoform X2 [Camelina sativa]|uniref:BTB/POZ domain-containing protein At5g47800 isoform X2 n=1 Tax=Camelina sativa TaxID=90675 RepID=A0ABM0X687_CAMSA|nr:PREDICTED: BTB/POZ domain-containing protein At5g47800 isoform X2 [Camelina sativa]
MKFMKIGTKPDTFYTQDASRILITDTPNDLVVRINNTTYHLHRSSLVPKCGLLPRLFTDSEESDSVTIELNDIPGGADAFELCAKFCYGITINLSAHNLVNVLCASTFLRMSDSVEKGNLLPKLEAFFHSCVLQGWKDSIVALQSTSKLPEWCENLGIIRKSIDSIVEKILTPIAEVSWSHTYTRPGYAKRQHHSVPKDWWTEDISDLDLDLFRCVITAARSTFTLPPQLIGEALHVYTCRWLPYFKSKSHSDKGSVSEGFLLRLVSIASYVGASLTTKTELIRKAGLQLDEATLEDLLLRSHSSSHHRRYDTDLVATVLESFLMLWRRQSSAHLSSNNSQLLHSIRKVAKLIDSYLQAVAQDVHMSVSKFVSLAEAVPDIARESHDRLYKAINTYLKVHPEISKEEKKQLCRSLDCQKLSAEVRARAVKNERMPLRTVVQALFFDQESSSKGASSRLDSQELFSRGKETSTDIHSRMHKLHLGQAETASIGKAKNILEGAKRGEEKIRSSTDPKKIVRKGTRSEHKHHISRDR